MNPFKPKRTFESVVRELVAGLEDGTIVLSEENAASELAKAEDISGDTARQVLKILGRDPRGRKAIERALIEIELSNRKNN